VEHPLEQLPAAAAQKGLRRPRGAVDDRVSHRAGHAFEPREEFTADAHPAVPPLDEAGSGPGRQLPVGGNGLRLKGGDPADEAVHERDDADGQHGAVQERAKVLHRVGAAAGAVVGRPLALEPLLKQRQRAGMLDEEVHVYSGWLHPRNVPSLRTSCSQAL
jgi:hypothetical protein